MSWDNIYDFFPRLLEGITRFCRDFYELLFTEFNFIGLGTLTLFDFLFGFTVSLLVARITANILFP